LKSKYRRNDQELSEPDINEGIAKEAELVRLQRQYRLMEGDRKSYCDSSKSLLAKQRESIVKLQKENSLLHFQLTLVERRLDYQEKNGIRHKKAKETINKGEMYVKKYKSLLEKIQIVDAKIKNMREEIENKKHECSGDYFFKQSPQYKQHVIAELENKLNKALVKFNQTLAINKKTRSLIDDLRGERACFDNLSRKYEKAINEQKKKMTDVIEASTTAYEMRLEAQNRISVLKEKTEKENQAFIQEMNEINRQLEHDQKLRQFMNTKNQEKVIKVSSKKKKEGQVNEEESIFEMYNNVLNNYESTFNMIRKETGIEDINEFVRTFNDIEDKNFSLFNYVSEISNEIEYSENEIKALKEKIELLEKEEKENQEKKQETIKHMEECLESSKEKNEGYINDTRSKQNIVDIICQNITVILQKLIEFKPPPGAEFYLTPSTFVTNAQSIIEKQNKLNENTQDDTGNTDDSKVTTSSEDKPATETEIDKENNDDTTEAQEKTTNEASLLSENKESESPLTENENKSEGNKESDLSPETPNGENLENENGDKKEEAENTNNGETKESNEIKEANENNESNENNEEKDKSNESDEANIDKSKEQENNVIDNEDKEEKKDSPTEITPDAEDQKKDQSNLDPNQDNSNGKPTTPNNVSEEDIKKNMKLSEDVINLILNKSETNKIIDKEVGRNATIINLLNDEKVDSINLIEVIRYIEEKTNELLVFNYMTHLPKRKDSSENEIKPTEKMFMSSEEVDTIQNITLLGPGPEAPITNLNIKIPESEDLPEYLNSGEEEKRLFTRDELTKRTIMNYNNKTKNKEETNSQLN
jgi:hypothetical protein